MLTYSETADVARILGQGETRLRRLIRRGVLQPSAMTARGTALFSQQDIEIARAKLDQERKPS